MGPSKIYKNTQNLDNFNDCVHGGYHNATSPMTPGPIVRNRLSATKIRVTVHIGTNQRKTGGFLRNYGEPVDFWICR